MSPTRFRLVFAPPAPVFLGMGSWLRGHLGGGGGGHVRAPAGYTRERPLVIGGKPFIGGEFVPADVLARATPEQRAALGVAPAAQHVEARKEPAPPAAGDADPRRAAAGAEYQRLGTRAPAFLKWFGDWEHDPGNASKVVKDGEPAETAPVEISAVRRGGKPVVVYHGTPHGSFEQFMSSAQVRPDSLYYGPGFYFTEDPTVAEVYAHSTRYGEADRPAVMQVYLAIRKPWDIDKDRFKPSEVPEAKHLRSVLVQKAFIEGGAADAREAARAFDADEGDFGYADLAEQYGVSKTELNKSLQARGYDGFTLMAVPKDRSIPNRQWIAFRPTQIKSVANTGTFDPDDDRIAMATRA